MTSDVFNENNEINIFFGTDSESMGNVNSLDRPLSPVLNSNRHNRRMIYGKRTKSRINLESKFDATQSPKRKSLPHAGHVNKAETIADSTGESSKHSKPADKLHKIREVEKHRKKCYDMLSAPDVKVAKHISPLHDANEILPIKKNQIKKIVVNERTLGGHKSNKESKLKTQHVGGEDLKSKETVININIKGFKTGTGKNIEVSENALKKGNQVLSNILNPMEVTASKTLENPAKIENAKSSGNKNVVEVILPEKEKRIKSNKVPHPHHGKIKPDIVSRKNESSPSNNKRKNANKLVKSSESISFTQVVNTSGITNTQLNFAMDTILPIVEIVNDKCRVEYDANNVLCGDEGGHIRETHIKKCVNSTNLNCKQFDSMTKTCTVTTTNTPNYSETENEMFLSTQETNLYFRDFTQNIVNRKSPVENAIDQIFIPDDTTSSERLFQETERAERKNRGVNENEMGNFCGYSNSDVVDTLPRYQAVRKLLAKLESDVTKSKTLKAAKIPVNLKRFAGDNCKKEKNALSTIARCKSLDLISEYSSCGSKRKPSTNSTIISPNKNVQIEIKNNNVINISINTNCTNSASTKDDASTMVEFESTNGNNTPILPNNEFTKQKLGPKTRSFTRREREIPAGNEKNTDRFLTSESAERGPKNQMHEVAKDAFTVHQQQLERCIKQAFDNVKFDRTLAINKKDDTLPNKNVTVVYNAQVSTENVIKDVDLNSPVKKRNRSDRRASSERNLSKTDFSGRKADIAYKKARHHKKNPNSQKTKYKDLLTPQISDKKETKVYWSTASGKAIHISDNALNKAKHQSNELDRGEFATLPKVTEENFKTVMTSEHFFKRSQEIYENNIMEGQFARSSADSPTKTLRKPRKLCKPHMENNEQTIRPFPFTCLLDEEISNIENTPQGIKPYGEYKEEVHNTFDASENYLHVDKLEKSQNAYKKTKRLYSDLETMPSTSFVPAFKSARGKTSELRKESLLRARQMFSNLDSEHENDNSESRHKRVFETSLNHNRSPVNSKCYARDIHSAISITDFSQTMPNLNYVRHCNLELRPTKSMQCMQELSQCKSEQNNKKAYEIIEDVVQAVDNVLATIERKELTKQKNRNSEKSEIPQTAVTPQKTLERESFRNCLTPKSTTKTLFTSTPVIKTSMQSFHCDLITPIKYTTTKKIENVADEANHLTAIILGDAAKLCTKEDYGEEIEKLKRKLLTFEERKEALQIQNNLIENGDNHHRRQRPGYLYEKKNRPKIPMSNLIFNEVSPQLNDNILKISSKNAHQVNFATRDAAVLRTIDGAILIPNIQNTVGLKEIERAFLAMPGVEPKLTPEGWVTNHYRWIIWKLAGYERKFSNVGLLLTIENVIQQLKYRYDREIDRAERSALKKILEKDDVPEKSMVLCVANVFQVSENRYELELTDGWYGIRTNIDVPLCNQVTRRKIVVGTKLMVQGAILLNCDGCSPLQVSEYVRLKIGYNNTRRVKWFQKLGYQKISAPCPISLSSVHPMGGTISCLKLYIARVYPLNYLELQDDKRIWRNEMAENKAVDAYEAQVQEKIDLLIGNMQKECEAEVSMKYNLQRISVSRDAIRNIDCSKTLFEMLESTKDPDMMMEMLTPVQRGNVLDYKHKMTEQRQVEVNSRVMKEITELKLTKRKVSPLLKLFVYDITGDCSKGTSFCIYNPTEEHLGMLKEEKSFLVYNVISKRNCELSTTSTTFFRSINSTPRPTLRRTILPIAMTMDEHYTPSNKEFDTLGITVEICLQERYQELWLSDFVGRLLFIRMWIGPSQCNIFHSITRGQVIMVSNLIYCKPDTLVGLAIANHFTTVLSKPKEKCFQDAMATFKKQLPEDLTPLLENCCTKIEMCRHHIDVLKDKSRKNISLSHESHADTMIETWDESNSLTSFEMTDTDLAMSLLNTQPFR